MASACLSFACHKRDTTTPRLVTDRETGKSKGYGFCEYHDHAAADSAVRNLTGHEMGGRQLRVSHAEEHQQMRDGERMDRWSRGPPRGGGPGGDREYRRPPPGAGELNSVIEHARAAEP